MQPTEKAIETRPMEQTPRAADKDLLREAVREQGDRGQTKFDIVLLSVQRLLRRGAITNLAKMLSRMHPADVAKVVTHLSSPKEKREVFELVRGESKRGQVLSELDSESITQVLADLLQSDIAWLIKDLAPDDVAYILGVLPEERAKEILSLMRTEDSTEVAGLLKYPKDTAGGIMTTEFFSMSEDTTAQEAIRRLQQASDAEMVFYIYVTDKNEHLVGVLSLRQLLTVPAATPLKNIATREVISVSVDMDQEEVARQVASYNLLAIPVVDKTGILVGIITVDDVVDVIREEATEDMLKMAGAVEQEAVSKSSSVAAAKVRLPWLFTNLVGSLLSGAILWEFRYTIQEVVAIVSFIPVIAAMGGNVGLQSSTLIIRGLATGLVESTDVWTIVLREVKIGLLMGVACGIILTVVGWIWHQGFLGMVVGTSLLTAFLVSTSMATFMPIFLKRMGIDPAVAAGPFVTTANDITGITIYLTLATVFMEYLR
jgi:magnesium transporter